MKKSLPLLAALSLAACSGAAGTVTLEQNLQNPLYAEQYYDVLLDRMVELDIQDDPLMQDASKAALVEDTRLDALKKAKEATQRQREGATGQFIGAGEEVRGEALYANNMLYFGPTFETYPGPELHAFLSTVVDPRDVEFPDGSSLDLGRVESAFGAQSMAVPEVENPLLYRTVALWDTKLERLYGFAQLAQ